MIRKKGTCFKVSVAEQKIDKETWTEILEEAVFENDPEDFLHYYFLANYNLRKSWDSQNAEYKPLYVFEKDGVKYFFIRQCTKKVLLIKPREYLYVIALRKIENGNLIYSMCSYDDRNYPENSNLPRAQFATAGGYIKLNENVDTLMTNKTLLDQSLSKSRLDIDYSNLKKMYRYTL